MQAQKAIQLLSEIDPDTDVIMDFYVKDDYKDYNLTDTEWQSVGRRADKTLSWYLDVQDLVDDVVSERK